MSLEPVLVLLAAGAARRLGEPKALVQLRPGLRAGPGEPSTPLEFLLRDGAALGASECLVVLGHQAARLAARLPPGLPWIENQDWEAGRTGSVRRAAQHLAGRDLCLAPVDVPLAGAEAFARLGQAWRQHGRPPRGWLAPWVATEAGRAFGHPLLLGRELLLELKNLPSGRPLRELRALARPLLAVEVSARGILDDLDTPADLERLRTLLRAPEEPA